MATGTYHTGLMVGFERGHIDRQSNQRQAAADLWMPDDTTDEYRQGVVAGYLRGITGETLPDEQMGK